MLVRMSTVALAASVFSTPWLAAAATPDDVPADMDVRSLLSTAQSHLLRGQTNDALVYYDAAIAKEPDNYLTYFKRATTHLGLGRTAQATDDLNKVLALRPGFEGAHMSLGRIRARLADWDGAREQFVAAGKMPGESEEFDEMLAAKEAAALAEAAALESKWEECVQHAGTAISVATRAVALYEMRARCRFEKGEVEEGMFDLQHVLRGRPGDIAPFVKISAVTYFALGDLQNGMSQIRKCLHSDPDSKKCKKLLKQEKAIEKAVAKVEKAFEKKQPMSGTKVLIPSSEGPGLIQEVKDTVQALKDDGIIPAKSPNALVTRLVELACQGYYDMNSKKAKEYCDEALQLNEDSIYGLLYKAKALQDNESFDAAIETLKKVAELAQAADLSRDKQDMIQDLHHKAQVALKRSKTKDYYKVLGVAHDADERQIKSAYRKLSKIHHPDKMIKSGLTKEEAEKKMASINEAYEVLSNPELRARFDRGDDPNSQEQRNPFQGSPFGGGQPFMFQQGGGGQQQFKFQFGSGGGGFPGGFPF